MCSYSLKISAKKVQSFIFQSPKLKHMLGANSLVGSLFCHDFVKLKKDNYPLPKLTSVLPNSDTVLDNPHEAFQYGIVSSAGGHFEGIFKDRIEAINFANEAAAIISKNTPGLQVEFFLEKVVMEGMFDPKKHCQNALTSEEQAELRNAITPLFIDNPFMQIGSDGINPTLQPDKDSKKSGEETEKDNLSLLEDQADLFYKLETIDILSEWYRSLNINDSDSKVKIAKKLDELCKLSTTPKANMLAIVKLDGNAVGAGFNKFKANLSACTNKDSLWKIEDYWFNKRQSIRKTMSTAVIAAMEELEKVNNKIGINKTLPFSVLMMGGDDILMVCIPEFVYQFVKAFKENIPEDTTFSIGVAFFKYNYPFAHAHDLAESLLESAKVKSRAATQDGKPQNALDWHLLSSTKPQSIDEIRRKDYLIKYAENHYDILTQRPYSLEEGLKVFQNAEELLTSLKKSPDEDRIGRNKYKTLRISIYKGKRHTEHLISSLFPKERAAWVGYNKAEETGAISTTQILDIVELTDVFPGKADSAEEGGENDQD